MKINDKITAVRNACLTDPNEGAALAELGIAAISDGMGSPAWRDLMNRFTTDQKELTRLNGEEQEFMGKEWGPLCLVYVSGDSTCTSETAMETGTHRTIDNPQLAHRRMRELLDAEGEDLAEFP